MKRILALILILLATIAYLPSFHAEFQFDDKDFIVNNPAIRDITDFPEMGLFGNNAARFLPFLSFAANYHFHKLDVFGYHLVNFIIHIINALLVWWLAGLLLGTSRRWAAYFAALIFLLHPVQTEAVTYIVQRFASMATMFYLFALCLFITARRGGVAPPSTSGRGNRARANTYFALSAIFAVCAMFSKQIAFTLPFMIIAYEMYFHERRSGVAPPSTLGRGNRAPTIIAILTFLIFVLIIPFLYDFNAAAILGREYASRSHQGDTLTWLTYFLTQSRVLVRYICLLFIPAGLNFDYDFSASTTLFDGPTFMSFLLLGALIALAVKLYAKHRIISFCIAWFFITLVVESSIIVLPHVIYEHRLYLPLVGFSILLAYTVHLLGKKLLTRKFALNNLFSNLTMIITILIIIIYTVLTYQRNLIWQNGISLWSDVIKKSPEKARGYHNRGFHYLQAGEYEKALKDFNTAIDLTPEYLQAYSNRATAYRALGRFNEALADYNKAIELRSGNAQAYHNRGQLYAAAGQTERALADYAQALEIMPDYFLAHHNRGRLYTQMGAYDKAVEDFSRALALFPDFSFSYSERGKAYLFKKMNEKALNDFSRALELNPKDIKSYNNRAICYSRMKEYDKGIADLDRVIALDPGNAAAFFNRSLIYLAKKDFKSALSDAKRAEELDFAGMEGYLKKLETLVAEK